MTDVAPATETAPPETARANSATTINHDLSFNFIR
jgi:hypothetical protein